jgi:hypothetical protein
MWTYILRPNKCNSRGRGLTYNGNYENTTASGDELPDQEESSAKRVF